MLYRFVLLMFIAIILNGCSKGGSQENVPPTDPMDLIPNPKVETNPVIDYNLWKIKNGKFYIGGVWKFLKIAKPLRDYSSDPQVDQLIADLDKFRNKYYNAIEINCYWHHFDTN